MFSTFFFSVVFRGGFRFNTFRVDIVQSMFTRLLFIRKEKIIKFRSKQIILSDCGDHKFCG